MCTYDDRCVSSKKLLFVMQNLGIWEIIGTGGQNMSSKVPYLESPTLICLFTMQLYGATIMIKGSLLLSAPIVKHFGRKKLPFWAKI